MRIVKFVGVVLSALFVLALAGPAVAFDSGSTGADGALVISESTQLQLPEDGVFNFTTVTVNAGAVLTFLKNANNTPVTILATGDVIINGEINVNGADGVYIIPGVGGSGGFDGGVGGVIGIAGQKAAGPGGGQGGSAQNNLSYQNYGASGGGGSYALAGEKGNNSYYGGAVGGAGGAVYGNKRLIPLLGGSGGGGGGGTLSYVGGAGGGGGGAILIASSTSVKIATSGVVSASGGIGISGEHVVNIEGSTGGSGGGGAGGAIRILAPVCDVNGSLTAVGGGSKKAYRNYYGGTGGGGYIRLEYEQFKGVVKANPPFSTGALYTVYPPNMPSLKIVSIDGVSVEGTPAGNYGKPDILLPFTTKNPIDVVIQAQNVDPVGMSITLKVSPAVGSSTSATGTLAGDFASSTTNIPINISTAHPSIITAYVTIDVVAAFGRPMFIEGESVAQVRFESTVGQQESSAILITESGREIPYTL